MGKSDRDGFGFANPSQIVTGIFLHNFLNLIIIIIYHKIKRKASQNFLHKA